MDDVVLSRRKRHGLSAILDGISGLLLAVEDPKSQVLIIETKDMMRLGRVAAKGTAVPQVNHV